MYNYKEKATSKGVLHETQKESFKSELIKRVLRKYAEDGIFLSRESASFIADDILKNSVPV